MNQEVKANWVAALRSGKYRKGRRFLKVGKDNCAYCVVGVLTDLATQAGVITSHLSPDTTDIYGRPVWEFHAEDDKYRMITFAPSEVMEWAGIPEGFFKAIESGYGLIDLVTLNDDYDLSFDELADLIEAQL